MSDDDVPEPELVEVAAVPTAVVAGEGIGFDDLPAFFDDAFGVLPGVLAAQGVTPTGPAFGLYRALGEVVDLEVGFPVDRPVEAEGRVRPGSLPAGRVARVVHAGGFDGLGPVWEGLRAWLVDQGLTPGAGTWEVYLTEPTPDMDPADLRTELNWPVG